jgi:glycine/D-amino acid oxidase-like deaminating enzyme
VIEKQMKKGLLLYTHTPVQSIESHTSGAHLLHTPRGTIRAKSIIITTNGYTANLLPELAEKIIPVRGTVCSITPDPSHQLGSSPGPLRYTYGMRKRAGESDYLIPRQGRGLPGVGDQSIILGGAKGVFLAKTEEWYNNLREDELMPGAKEYIEKFMRQRFSGWSQGHEKIDRIWTGGE